MTEDFDNPETVETPKTVADLIAILQKYPKNFRLGLFKEETDCSGSVWAETVYNLKVKPLENSEYLEITI